MPTDLPMQEGFPNQSHHNDNHIHPAVLHVGKGPLPGGLPGVVVAGVIVEQWRKSDNYFLNRERKFA